MDKGRPGKARTNRPSDVETRDLDRVISASEDVADVAAARGARQEMADGAHAIPWEQVRSDLGPD